MYVTNDITEVMAIADRLAVLNDGTIQQIGEPRAVYDRPANRFVADFVGETPMNFIPVRIETDARGAWLVTDGLRIRSWAPEVAAYRPRNAILGVRPEDIDIDPAGDVGATVLRSTRYGARSETELAIGPVRMWMRRRGPPPPGREMLRLRFVRWHVFTDDDGRSDRTRRLTGPAATLVTSRRRRYAPSASASSAARNSAARRSASSRPPSVISARSVNSVT